MELTDEITIPAPCAQVYAALNDTDVLRKCIPGCEEITRHSETELEAKVLLKIGPVKARFTGAVVLDPVDPPREFHLTGSGTGGAAGFAKGGGANHAGRRRRANAVAVYSPCGCWRQAGTAW